MPYALEALGFAELGPVEGEMATWKTLEWSLMQSFRIVCYLVAVHLWRLCDEGIFVCIFPAAGNGHESIGSEGCSIEGHSIQRR